MSTPSRRRAAITAALDALPPLDELRRHYGAELDDPAIAAEAGRLLVEDQDVQVLLARWLRQPETAEALAQWAAETNAVWCVDESWPHQRVAQVLERSAALIEAAADVAAEGDADVNLDW